MSNRKRVIAANWKMFKTAAEARGFCEVFLTLIADLDDDREILLFPPFTALSTVSKALEGTRVGVGGQNLFWEPEGAFTGEVSGPMLRDSGCGFVLVGHSERRQYFKEGDAELSKKLAAAFENNLTPLFCLGESLEDREGGRMAAVIKAQLTGALAELTASQMSRMIVAYEPVWAIGTGRTATPAIAQEAHHLIREWLRQRFEESVSGSVPILYGGSVKPANIGELMSEADIDGALVGGASLDPDSFASIVRF